VERSFNKAQRPGQGSTSTVVESPLGALFAKCGSRLAVVDYDRCDNPALLVGRACISTISYVLPSLLHQTAARVLIAQRLALISFGALLPKESFAQNETPIKKERNPGA
jgi:hypothetical protein